MPGIVYIDDLLIGYQIIVDGSDVEYPRERKLKFAGGAVVDDAASGITTVTVSGTGVDLSGDLGNTVATPQVRGWYGKALDAGFAAPGYDGAVPHYDSGAGTWKVGGAHAAQVDAIGTAQTPGVTLRNTTVATAGTPKQYTPMQIFEGRLWDGAASQTIQAGLQYGANGLLNLYFQYAGGGWTNPLGLDGSTVLFDGTADAALKLSNLGAAGDGKTLTIGGSAVTSGAGTNVLFEGGTAVGTDKAGGVVRFATGKATGAGALGKVQVETNAGTALTQWFDDSTLCLLVGASDGLAHFSSGGFVSSSLLVNADVSASAAIDGSKINPAFGAQTVSAAAFVGVFEATGTVAAAGDIRLGTTMLGKWYDGTADRTWIDYNSRLSNGLGIGDAGVPLQLFGTTLELLSTLWPGDPIAGDAGKSLVVTAANTIAWKDNRDQITFNAATSGNSAGAARLLYPGGYTTSGAGGSGSERSICMLMGRNGAINGAQSLYKSGALATANTTYTVRKSTDGGASFANTVVTWSVAAGVAAGSDTAHSFTFNAGDLISVQSVTDSADATTSMPSVTLDVIYG